MCYNVRSWWVLRKPQWENDSGRLKHSSYVCGSPRQLTGETTRQATCSVDQCHQVVFSTRPILCCLVFPFLTELSMDRYKESLEAGGYDWPSIPWPSLGLSPGTAMLLRTEGTSRKASSGLRNKNRVLPFDNWVSCDSLIGSNRMPQIDIRNKRTKCSVHTYNSS
jgi:hypothetical protein